MNEKLVVVFNEILSVQETALKHSGFLDLSVKEMHTIEAIDTHGNMSSNQVAKTLNVTPGTLTVAIQNLVKKGYITRVQSEEDRRVVKLQLTDKGKEMVDMYQQFHQEMVTETLTDLDPEEVKVLSKGLNNLHKFFGKKEVRSVI